MLFKFGQNQGYLSFVEELKKELLGSDGILEKIYLGNPDTLILKFVSGKRNVIARIPFTQEANNRCIRSQQTLEELGWFKYDGVRLAPSAKGKLILNGLHIYIESAILGESIGDVSCRDVQYIDSAIDIITRLHLATVSNTIINDEVYSELIGALIRKLEKNLHPSFAERIQWIATYFEQSFLNKSIPLVFNHGDYKLENILVKEEDCSLAGVIDWDLSVEKGMPLVDIIHLLAYEKHDESNLPIDEVIMGHWVPGQQSLEKKDCILVDQYMSALNIPKELFKPLVSFYWLDNVAKRFSTNGKYFNSEFVEKFVLPVFDEIKDRSINEMQVTR
jgi:thiamine kinase-like enzyme